MLVLTNGVCQVRKLHAFVRDKYPNAEILDTVVVSSGMVEQLDAVADEAVAQGSWFEVTAGQASCMVAFFGWYDSLSYWAIFETTIVTRG